jgi:hypothetical protein
MPDAFIRVPFIRKCSRQDFSPVIGPEFKTGSCTQRSPALLYVLLVSRPVGYQQAGKIDAGFGTALKRIEKQEIFVRSLGLIIQTALYFGACP